MKEQITLRKRPDKCKAPNTMKEQIQLLDKLIMLADSWDKNREEESKEASENLELSFGIKMLSIPYTNQLRKLIIDYTHPPKSN